MNAEELKRIRSEVAQAGEKIQPLLLPHESLARRNAFAHIWLGIRTIFSEHWRDGGRVDEVSHFIDWIGKNPNADYESFGGQVTPCPPHAKAAGQRGLFDTTDDQ